MNEKNEQEKQESQALLDMFKPYEHFSKCMLDAYALVRTDGKVVKCNQLLSVMLGKKTKQILKSDGLSEHIRLTLEGENLSITDLMKHQNPTRIDEVRGATDLQDDFNLILGVYPFWEDDSVKGMFLLIRDVTAETNLQDKYKVKATQSITDKLTGLYNRTYFDQYLPETLNSLQQGGRRNDNLISVVMADIDHFKMINDTHGHQAGDFILEKIADIFKNNFRKTDVICRYGGEEFLTILPSTDENDARIAAEKLRAAVDVEDFVFKGTHIPVTISLGIAQIKVGLETGEQAIARADEALYYSKDNGRNRISIHHADGTIS